MMAYSMMVASHGGTTSGVCTPSMNQNIDSSYSRRSSLNTVENAYRSCHTSAPGGVRISNGPRNRPGMFFSSRELPPTGSARRIMGLAVPLGRARDGFHQGRHDAGDRI